MPSLLNRIPVNLTRGQVENAPPLESLGARVEARRGEALLQRPSSVLSVAPEMLPHLNSTRRMRGFRVEASCGTAGRVREFVIDDRSWTIRYVVARCRRWPRPLDVLLDVGWIQAIAKGGDRMTTAMPSEVLEDGSPFEREILNQPIDVQLYDYYGRPTHWVTSASSHG